MKLYVLTDNTGKQVIVNLDQLKFAAPSYLNPKETELIFHEGLAIVIKMPVKDFFSELKNLEVNLTTDQGKSKCPYNYISLP